MTTAEARDENERGEHFPNDLRRAQIAEWILAQTNDAMIYADTSGTIVRWNEAASRLLGYSESEAVGQRLDLVIPQHLRAAHWTGFDRAIAAGSTRLAGRPTVTRAVHKTGGKLYLEMTFALVKDDAGHVVGSVAMARDATDRVAQERRTG